MGSFVNLSLERNVHTFLLNGVSILSTENDFSKLPMLTFFKILTREKIKLSFLTFFKY